MQRGNDEPVLGRRFPERQRRRVRRQNDDVGGRNTFHRQTYFLNIRDETGIDAGPPVTSAISAPSTWLTAVPRSCSTASITCVIPMMYASDRLPPWVFTGIEPSGQRMLPSATNGPPSPIGAEAVVLELHDHHRGEVVVEQRDVDVLRADPGHV